VGVTWNPSESVGGLSEELLTGGDVSEGTLIGISDLNLMSK
jgi:hypothetical protein